MYDQVARELLEDDGETKVQEKSTAPVSAPAAAHTKSERSIMKVNSLVQFPWGPSNEPYDPNLAEVEKII